MGVKDVELWEKAFLYCSFQRKQKINIWSSWVAAVRKKVAETRVRKKIKPDQNDLL